MSYKNFTYQQPTEIIFGKNSINTLGEFALKYEAKKVLIVTGGESVKKSGLLDQVISQLEEAGIGCCLHPGCTPNPRSTFVDTGAAKYNKECCNFILAVGGGSVIDASKAMAMLLSNPNEDGIWHYMSGKGHFKKNAVPVAAVLTLAATGSECNDGFVISNDKTQEKMVNSHTSARPVFSMCDPVYTYTVGKWQTACGISDIISHVLEQYLYNDDTADVSDGMCIGILKAAMKWGPIALKHPDNYDSRANLMWASTIGLNGILGAGHGENWVTHMLEHALSALFDVSHGAGLACLTPRYMAFISEQDGAGKLDRLGIELFGIEKSDKDIKVRTVMEFSSFFQSLGMPSTLGELTKEIITDDTISKLAKKALPWGSMEVGGYRPFTHENAREVFGMCLE